MALSFDGALAVTAWLETVRTKGKEDEESTISYRAGKVQVWDVANLRVLGTLDDPSPVNAVAVSSDGRLALTASSEERTVRLWDLATRKPRPIAGRAEAAPFLSLDQGDGVIWSVAFSPDDRYVLTVGGQGARLWDVETGQERMDFSPQGTVASVSFSPDGQRIVSGSWDRSARIWDAATGQSIRKLVEGHEGFVNSAVFSPDGAQVLTASDDKTARLWDSQTGELLPTAFVGHTDRVRSAVFSADGDRVLTASNDRTARIWDAKSGDPLTVLEGHLWPVLCAVFSADGAYVLTGSEDNTARVWSAADGRLLATLTGHTAPVTSVAFSPDADRALTGSRDTAAKLWDTGLAFVRSGALEAPPPQAKEVLTLDGHRQEVTCVLFSPDGRSALTGSRDGSAILWLTTGWKAVAPPKPLQTAGRP
jgi:WD40 repeat protein